MSGKTLIGFGTFGGVEFTRELVKGIRETTTKEVDLFAVVGKPGDLETEAFLKDSGIPYKHHEVNMGFPYSVNDLYDWAWKYNNYDYLIVAGNDTIPYPYCVDSMIDKADTTEYEWISASQYDARTLVSQFPEVSTLFATHKMLFTAFDKAPWKLFKDYGEQSECEGGVIKDVQNFCLYKKSVFDKIGYTDVNFYPAYYIDNDYARRGVNAKLLTCNLNKAIYFHFWSRVLNQIGGGSNSVFFNNNRNYYIAKWNGEFAQERWDIPFDGKDYKLADTITLPGSLKISSRDNEVDIVNFWKSRG